jgi:drug/metabolite transporter (DMT)-like permease
LNPRSSRWGAAALFLATTIWGFAFVAQRAGMAHVGPHTFNAARFLLGAALLGPVALFLPRGRATSPPPGRRGFWGRSWTGGVVGGVFLFLGITFQQYGLVTTTSGKAGFITGMYVILVPVLGLAFGQVAKARTWAGAVLALAGMYFLSVTEEWTVARGDLLVLACALFWSMHVLWIAWVSPFADAMSLAAVQFLVAAALSVSCMAVTETPEWPAMQACAIPILYSGILSSAVAYPLQVVGQRGTSPAYAAIVFGLEAVFAALGGWVLLGETLSGRNLVGCGLMLAGMVVAQLERKPEKGGEGGRDGREAADHS